MVVGDEEYVLRPLHGGYADGEESPKPASAPMGAAFLRYASQDAEAAQRICQAHPYLVSFYSRLSHSCGINKSRALSPCGAQNNGAAGGISGSE